MEMKKDWHWRFLGFESALEGQPVQAWFDGLPEEARDEIIDLLNVLQKLTNRLWRKPEFDPLRGAGGISELRPADVPLENGGKLELATYRIYGYFGPVGGVYTLLHGVRKGVRNDRRGKTVARNRLGQIERREATTHEFDFQT
jgi:hypothetical protein